MKKEIIKMAQEAGLRFGYPFGIEHLERFAALVIQEDRQQLAKAIETMPFGDTASSFAKFVRDFKQ